MKANATVLAKTPTTSASFAIVALDWIVQYGLRVYGFVIMAYLLVTAYTGSFFMADTEDYVTSILAFPKRNVEFWDFGHILWRPIGWLAWELFRPIVTPHYKDPRSNVAFVLIAISWISGFASALLVFVMLRRYSRSLLVANVATFAFICSQAFLNYVHTGSPYVPGLLFLVVAMLLMLDGTLCEECSVGKAVVAGIAMAVAVGLWIQYLWVLPGLMLSPFILFGNRAVTRRFVFWAAVVLAFSVGAIYLAMLIHLGIVTIPDLKAWIASSAHGVQIHGFKRTVFGLGRTFTNMGNDGLLVKRFLLHDPYNPVSSKDLLLSGLWKLGLFYAFAATMFFYLLRTREGRRLTFLTLACAFPLLFFVSFYNAVDMEKYLPLYPLFFCAVALFFSERSPLTARGLGVAFLAVMVSSNLYSMSDLRLQREQDSNVARIGELVPQLRAADVVVVPVSSDELVNFKRTFPFHPLNENPQLRVVALFNPNTEDTPQWRERFSNTAITTWNKQGVVWVSKRLFTVAPRRDWIWAEGDDPRVRWKDLYQFFSPLETASSAGGEDGFLRLSDSPANRLLLVQR